MATPSQFGPFSSFTNAPGKGGFEKLQNSPFGSGSLTAGLSQRMQQAGGLSAAGATPVGRSTRDPARALEMLSRGTARPGQVDAAIQLENLQMQRRQDADLAQQNQLLQQAYQRMFGGAPAAGTMSDVPAQGMSPNGPTTSPITDQMRGAMPFVKGTRFESEIGKFLNDSMFA
jgi:hypothetical protein